MSIRSKLVPNIPAKPVPDEKKPTHSEGNPFRNPRVVLSPSAQLDPYSIEATNESQKKSSRPFGSKAQVAISKNANPITIATKVIRLR